MHIFECYVGRCGAVHEYRILQREGCEMREIGFVGGTHSVVKLCLYIIERKAVLVEDELAAVREAAYMEPSSCACCDLFPVL